MTQLTDDIELLEASRSQQRRSAAKRLRKLGDIAAGPALLARLTVEVHDVRTWETQYELIMALAECRYTEALSFLETFSRTTLEATMIYVAIGDALVRLQADADDQISCILKLMRSGNNSLADGAFRAMAMLKITPSEKDILQITDFVSRFELDHGIRFWPLAAAPGWDKNLTAEYIRDCSRSTREDLQEAAKLAAAGKYKNWRPL